MYDEYVMNISYIAGNSSVLYLLGKNNFRLAITGSRHTISQYNVLPKCFHWDSCKRAKGDERNCKSCEDGCSAQMCKIRLVHSHNFSLYLYI